MRYGYICFSNLIWLDVFIHGERYYYYCKLFVECCLLSITKTYGINKWISNKTCPYKIRFLSSCQRRGNKLTPWCVLHTACLIDEGNVSLFFKKTCKNHVYFVCSLSEWFPITGFASRLFYAHGEHENNRIYYYHVASDPTSHSTHRMCRAMFQFACYPFPVSVAVLLGPVLRSQYAEKFCNPRRILLK